MGQRADELTPHDDAGHSDAEIQQLRTGIARTRTEMGSTIDAIGKVEEMVDELDDRARSARMTLMETIRENPLPATVAGLGLGWLWMRSRSRTTVDQSRDWRSSSRASWSDMDRGRGGPDVTGTLGRAQDRAGEVVGQARDTVSHIAGDANDLANDASERVRRLATTAGSTARDTGFAVWDMIQSNPVPAALAGISLA
jgi:hypothetical protein